jgi:hypothetical protein
MNKHGGEHECVCKRGWKAVGDQCIASEWRPYDSTIRVENDAVFSNQWRIQDIHLYADATCQNELVQGHGAGSAGWSWSKFDDAYLPLQNEVFDAAKTCAAQCSTQTMAGPCRAFLGENDGEAMCLTFAECEELCASTEECIGFDMHEYLPRCYMNGGELGNAAVDASLRGEDVHYDLYVKQATLSVSSSSAFEYHPAELVLDDDLHSEWWSAEFRRKELQEYVEISLTAATPVRAIKVMQKPGHDVPSLRVSLALSGSSLDNVGKHIQHAETMHIEDRSNFVVTNIVRDASNGRCVDLTCGKLMLFSSPDKQLVPPFHHVPSACHCKQLCLDQYDEGCRSWLYTYEKDSNYYTDEATHVHTSCTLYTVPLSKHSAKVSTLGTAGDVDLILEGMAPTTAPSG